MNKTQKALKVLFHPYLVPTYLTVALLCSKIGYAMLALMNGDALWVILVAIFTSTCLLPFLVNKGVEYTSRGQARQAIKALHLISLSIFNYLGYYLLKGIPTLSLLSAYMLGETFLTVIGLIITAFWNVSIYGIVWGGVCGYWYALCLFSPRLFLWLLIASVLLCGIMGWNRLASHSHRPSQLYAGFGIGFAVMAVVVFILVR